MVQIKGKYFKGVITLQKEVSSEKPLDVIVVFSGFDEEKEETPNFSQFTEPQHVWFQICLTFFNRG